MKASTSSLGYNMRYKFPDTSESDSKKIKEMGAASEIIFNNQAMKQCDGEVARMLCISGLSFNVARNHQKFQNMFFLDIMLRGLHFFRKKIALKCTCSL